MAITGASGTVHLGTTSQHKSDTDLIHYIEKGFDMVRHFYITPRDKMEHESAIAHARAEEARWSAAAQGGFDFMQVGFLVLAVGGIIFLLYNALN